MPTIAVNRDELFKRLGRVYTEKEFDELCFEFGIELDEVTSEKQMKSKEQGIEHKIDENEEVIYRIEIPANRYDLLCIEGLALALNIFLGRQDIPRYQVIKPEKMEQLTILPNTGVIRPHAVAAILRGVNFTKLSYNSFIDLQDKLHQNLCRKRTLVAIGTHDLDTIKGPFVYDAKKPEEIKFIPLKQTKEFNAKDLLEFYLNDEHLKAYVPIIKDSPVYPVIYDSNDVVLSLPPIINGEHSKIKLETKNIFIECTATDSHKAEVVLDTLVCLFSEYSTKPFTVEPVKVVGPDNSERIWPSLKYRQESISLDYIQSNIGIKIDLNQVHKLLKRMGLESQTKSNTEAYVTIPPNRHDILHACDILEDIGISYGFNNIDMVLPQTLTIGSQFKLNKISDQLRFELARCGFTEALTFSLCSRDDIGSKMRLKNEVERAVKISNPKTLDFQVARTSLLPGLLKTINSNKKMPIPLKLFEISDIVLKDNTKDVGARNERFLSAIYYNKNSGFEVIHGLMDRIMQVIEIPYCSASEQTKNGYFIRAKNDPRFLDGRCAEILINDKVFGVMGVLHPEVITNFDLTQPCSALELSIESIY